MFGRAERRFAAVGGVRVTVAPAGIARTQDAAARAAITGRVRQSAGLAAPTTVVGGAQLLLAAVGSELVAVGEALRAAERPTRAVVARHALGV